MGCGLHHREGGALSLRAKTKLATAAGAAALIIIVDAADAHSCDLEELDEQPLTCVVMDNDTGTALLDIIDKTTARKQVLKANM